MTASSQHLRRLLHSGFGKVALAVAATLSVGLVMAVARNAQDGEQRVLVQGTAAQVDNEAPKVGATGTGAENQEVVGPSNTQVFPVGEKAPGAEQETPPPAAAAPTTVPVTNVSKGGGTSTTTPTFTRSSDAPGAVAGTVLLSPACPVERTPPEPGCAPRVGTAQIRLVAEGRVIASAASDAAGAFHIPVAPGRYRVEAVGPTGGIGKGCTAEPGDVTVNSGVVTSVTVRCDSGIR